MPHIHLEYSDNLTELDPKPLLTAIHEKMLAGHFVQSAKELKSRAIKQSNYLIGLGEENDAYLHAKVSVLSGRDEPTKIAISQEVLTAIQESFTQPENLNVQICVEIIEMPKSTYSKVALSAKHSI
ncbi:5-carboxymethyl-2-hydroxymuconate isomerase [Acinetobacter wanghuae]|uniref:5-carboxymethyl-2-hydroxymuconate isomerase n=1 Tax=Acinetobacter wanghuae TaxID=2662362 RepID=A0A5Q0P6J1_9GAMM|nr:5-carboxymethyl-2-hydroxymuconate Delta-isomerase [Acinetobacter wanghuae]MQW91364.1 5-carboxymethyl-2-hydroxymuconate isomerase [Acinetobacter wanghuae]QGA11731.1 5-carboxymethyl-2-hydroxymuconate isomerase [Acinetobacter wanghuae]